MLTERDMLERLATQSPSLPPLTFTRQDADHQHRRLDALYEVRWNQQIFRFVAEVKSRSTPQAIISAAHQARSLAYDLPGTLPLVVVPYLSPTQLDQVEGLEGISAVDLCGNGIVRAGTQFLIVRSGRPNLFREVNPLKAAYQGTSSLVARALALQHQFARVSEIHAFITSHGGRITLGTVSKALKRLAEDLVITREGKGVRVVQADKLLDQLRQSYRPPRIRARWTGKVALPEASLHARFLEVSERTESRLVLTGLSSAKHHAVIATEPLASFYCSIEPHALLRAATISEGSTRTFPNVELLQTDDESVFFDPRTADGQIISSPIQTWLELATGDKRTREVAEQLRVRLLNPTRRIEGTHGG